ncbi:hypothetical protein NSQ59_27335 [Margalitia sp. FSL K6-0131]|uniref:hypothetical protein n=1 Tax=Margalitia sp. FSL K6-0131 TaxID=2954604 RepID=UPI0030F5F0F3
MVKFKPKKIGDTTSLTIKPEFVHIQTGETIEVSPEMLRYINDQLKAAAFTNMILTLIYEHIEGRNKGGDIQREKKLDEILSILKHGPINEIAEILRSGNLHIEKGSPTSKDSTNVNTKKEDIEDFDDILKDYTQ